MFRTFSLAAALALTCGAVEAKPAAGKLTGLERAQAAHAATAERLSTKPNGTKGHATAAEKRGKGNGKAKGKGKGKTKDKPKPAPAPAPAPEPAPAPAPEPTPDPVVEPAPAPEPSPDMG